MSKSLPDREQDKGKNKDHPSVIIEASFGTEGSFFCMARRSGFEIGSRETKLLWLFWGDLILKNFVCLGNVSGLFPMLKLSQKM